MPRIHIFLDSPANTELTKTELDIGLITQPYVELAHCIRSGFCVSHALRDWVRISIGFHYQDSYVLQLDPTTIRYMGTDERSILHIILRAQEVRRRPKTKIPYGVSFVKEPIRDVLLQAYNSEKLLLLPNVQLTWNKVVRQYSEILMFCPLVENWDRRGLTVSNTAQYSHQIPRDVAILEVVHTLETL